MNEALLMCGLPRQDLGGQATTASSLVAKSATTEATPKHHDVGGHRSPRQTKKENETGFCSSESEQLGTWRRVSTYIRRCRQGRARNILA